MSEIPQIPDDLIEYSPEIIQAKKEGKPIVALESTIITHGMEYPENHLMLVAYIYETGQVVEIDIRDWILEESGRSRISQKYLNYLKNTNEGKKVWFEEDCDGDWDLQDYDDLDY